MSVLKGILSESKEYYLDTKNKIEKKMADLPKGSIKERKIAGKRYYYLQRRVGKKVRHKYLGKNEPADLLKQLKERKVFKAELKKVNEALRMLKKAEGRKSG
ncbi:MAG: hypothetical protein A3I43_04110 [Omnitrophica WOR_2 bacterium RIFCSPLOWO2_02_FULL_50_19]|nr:MAG: hypothetical protein A3I43_04110 [Omnitrophica WOR_2 bacterium RIFCSPLOWO2_02_FULL_50_19]